MCFVQIFKNISQRRTVASEVAIWLAKLSLYLYINTVYSVLTVLIIITVHYHSYFTLIVFTIILPPVFIRLLILIIVIYCEYSVWTVVYCVLWMWCYFVWLWLQDRIIFLRGQIKYLTYFNVSRFWVYRTTHEAVVLGLYSCQNICLKVAALILELEIPQQQPKQMNGFCRYVISSFYLFFSLFLTRCSLSNSCMLLRYQATRPLFITIDSSPTYCR